MAEILTFPSNAHAADQRRNAFFDYSNWQVSRRGNSFIRTPGATVTIFPTGTGFKYAIARSAAVGPTYSTSIYETEAEARRAAWAALAGMMEQSA